MLTRAIHDRPRGVSKTSTLIKDLRGPTGADPGSRHCCLVRRTVPAAFLVLRVVDCVFRRGGNADW